MLILAYNINDPIAIKGTIKNISIDENHYVTYNVEVNGVSSVISIGEDEVVKGAIKPIAGKSKDSDVIYTYGDRVRIFKPGNLNDGQCCTIVGYRRHKEDNGNYLLYRVTWNDGDIMQWFSDTELTPGWRD